MSKKQKTYKRDLELLVIVFGIVVGVVGYYAYINHPTVYYQAAIFINLN